MADDMRNLIETIGRGSFAAHIREQIMDNQRAVAVHYASMDGMQWPDNLLGQMVELLSSQDGRAVERKIENWRTWIEGMATVQKMLERTLVLVEAFLIFYQTENGGNG